MTEPNIRPRELFRAQNSQHRVQEEESQAVCPECESQIIHDSGRGESLCEACGLVLGENRLDRGPEWRAFDDEESERSRVGAPITLLMHDKGLSTTIGWQDKDAAGRQIPPSKRAQLQRLRTWDERFRTKNAHERNLKQALGEIARMASALGLPDTVRETASVIYRRVLENDLLPGRSIEGVATAALYAAARQAGTPRTLDEITDVSRVDKMELSRTYRYIARQLGLAVMPADPVSYLPRFTSDLDLSEEVARRARDLLETAKAQGIHSGRSPVGLAAAAIYPAALLSNEEVTQREVSEVAGVSEVTIRKRYKELLDVQEPSGGE